MTYPPCRMHTVMVVGPTAEIYACGLAASGQLGTGLKKNHLTPTPIQLGDPPANFRPPDAPMDLGTPVDAESAKSGVGVATRRGFGERFSLKRVFAGGDQTFAAVETCHGNTVRLRRGVASAYTLVAGVASHEGA